MCYSSLLQKRASDTRRTEKVQSRLVLSEAVVGHEGFDARVAEAGKVLAGEGSHLGNNLGRETAPMITN